MNEFENFNFLEKENNPENFEDSEEKIAESERIRKSGISRVIGYDPNVEEEILEYFEKTFSEGKSFGDFEIEKPEEFYDLMDIINEKLEDFLSKYGGDYIKIPPENIYLLDREKFNDSFETNKGKINGFYDSRNQLVCCIEEYKKRNKIKFLNTLIHEIIHLNSFQSFQKINEDQKNEKSIRLAKENKYGGKDKEFLNIRRTGLKTFSKEGSVYLYDMDEAVTEELTRKFGNEYFSEIPQISEECEEINEIKKALKKNKNFDDDYISDISYVEEKRLGDKKTINLITHSYVKERAKLNEMIDEIYETKSDQFSSKEEVFDIFAKASMTGRILPLARIIKDVYGIEIFKKIRDEKEESNFFKRKKK